MLDDLARCSLSARRVSSHGRDAFLDPDDDLLRLAASALVINAWSALDRLSPEFRAQHPTEPWAAVRATRNVVAHAYDRVNQDILWSAVSTELPELVNRLTSEGR